MIPAISFSNNHNCIKNLKYTIVDQIINGSYISFENIDLTNAIAIDINMDSANGPNLIEVHINSWEGPVIDALDILKIGDLYNYTNVRIHIIDTIERNDIYFVFKGTNPYDNINNYLFNVKG